MRKAPGLGEEKTNMGYDLGGAGGAFHFGVDAWPMVLELACLYGWEPAGTVSPHWRCAEGHCVCGEWDGGYCSNSGQAVTPKDAQVLAEALERALVDIPDERVLDSKEEFVGDWVDIPDESVLDLEDAPFPIPDGEVYPVGMDDSLGQQDPEKLPLLLEGQNVTVNAFEWFSGKDGKDDIRKFIAFCRRGGFTIL